MSEPTRPSAPPVPAPAPAPTDAEAQHPFRHSPNPHGHWQAGRFRIALDRVQVMAIVNTTPDSFSDGGHAFSPSDALARCEAALRDGADILDIGGESTRPGASPVGAEEELRRVLPVVREAVTLGVPVSVDTSKAAVIAAVLDAGADIVNDVRALREPGALDACRGHGRVGVCLMHTPGEPQVMQSLAVYDDVVQAVCGFLAEQAARVRAAGFTAEQIVLDPGYGFGKNKAQNLHLLRGQRALLALGYPLLAGLSRKSVLCTLTRERPPLERMAASVAAALAAVEGGARIVRVHDVAETVDALAVWRAVRPLVAGPHDDAPL